MTCEFSKVRVDTLKCGDHIRHTVDGGRYDSDIYMKDLFRAMHPVSRAGMFRTKYGLNILIDTDIDPDLRKIRIRPRLIDFYIDPMSYVWKKN